MKCEQYESAAQILHFSCFLSPFLTTVIRQYIVYSIKKNSVYYFLTYSVLFCDGDATVVLFPTKDELIKTSFFIAAAVLCLSFSEEKHLHLRVNK